ncbi:G5 domain-containing protein [Facklamia sp. 7083-14-GEN3]|uniref:G5 domain-containing protein n=1 Tax=Facklamia sp. 7083-14-GEN3 TaxID=2973478 RepID=UPI00215D56AF|nr:G5 domain-containing protein [Facklamia sp. 7083-14-GEN3]MCR8968890.1 G5 domain-containing protein [Facklamia sp. 7083-14-GEN3]
MVSEINEESEEDRISLVLDSTNNSVELENDNQAENLPEENNITNNSLIEDKKNEANIISVIDEESNEVQTFSLTANVLPDGTFDHNSELTPDSEVNFTTVNDKYPILRKGRVYNVAFPFKDSDTGVWRVRFINTDVLNKYNITSTNSEHNFYDTITFEPLPNEKFRFPKNTQVPFSVHSPVSGLANVEILVQDGAGNISKVIHVFKFAEPLPFEVIREADLNLNPGEEKVAQEGKNGGVVRNALENQTKDEIVKAKVDKIIKYGPAELPFETIRKPNINLKPSEEKVVNEGAVGRIDEEDNILKAKVDKVIEYGPAESPFDTIRKPNLDLKPGEEKVVNEGTYGRIDEEDNILKEKVDKLVEYGPAELPFDTIREPNSDLKPGEEKVVTEGVVGRVDEEGKILKNKVDEVIEYGPEGKSTVPAEPTDPKKPTNPSSPKERTEFKLPSTGEIVFPFELSAFLLLLLGFFIQPFTKKIKKHVK